MREPVSHSLSVKIKKLAAPIMENAMTPTDKTGLPPEAAGVMTDDHAEIGQLIDELRAALDKGDRAQSFEHLDLLWARLAVHIRAEHLCLFPAILGAPLTNLAGSPQHEEVHIAIDLLRHDHDFFMRELATAVNAMRKHETVSDAAVISVLLREVRGSVVAVETRLRAHNRLEEEQVYTWADLFLGETERSELTTRMTRELQNMPQRFQQL